MQWDTLYTFGQIFGVAAVAATLVAGAITFYAGWKVNKAQKEENRVKEEQRERERQVSDEQIAKANVEAARANEGLAEANAKIAKANERAENAIAAAAEARAKQEELALESRAKQTELAEAQTKLLEEQTKLADAQRKQAEAELALRKILDDVAKRQGPRMLSQDQRAEIIKALRGREESEKRELEMLRRLPPELVEVAKNAFIFSHPPHRVSIEALDVPEASKYADQLNEAIIAAGWETVMITRRSQVPPVFGIVCQNCDGTIELALRSAGIPFRNEQTDKGPRVQARLIIGLKEP